MLLRLGTHGSRHRGVRLLREITWTAPMSPSSLRALQLPRPGRPLGSTPLLLLGHRILRGQKAHQKGLSRCSPCLCGSCHVTRHSNPSVHKPVHDLQPLGLLRRPPLLPFRHTRKKFQTKHPAASKHPNSIEAIGQASNFRGPWPRPFSSDTETPPSASGRAAAPHPVVGLLRRCQKSIAVPTVMPTTSGLPAIIYDHGCRSG